MSDNTFSKLFELNYKALQLVKEHAEELENKLRQITQDGKEAQKFFTEVFGEDSIPIIRRNMNLIHSLPYKQTFAETFYKEFVSNTLLYKLFREHNLIQQDMSLVDIVFQTWISTLRSMQLQLDFSFTNMG